MTCKDSRNGHTDRGLDTQSANLHLHLHLHLLEPILSGERGPDLHEVSGHGRVWGSPQANSPERKKDRVLLLRVPDEQRS
jgi:hypothetical protein